MIVYVIGGGLLVSVLIAAVILGRLANRLDLLQRELRASNERLREQVERVISETSEEREERERKESERRVRAKQEEERRATEKAEREAREREMRKQAVSSYSSSTDDDDDDDYCRCSSPGDACTWK